MTEDEAELKACCGPRNNAQTAEDSDVLCIGSRCMAWRMVREEISGTDQDGFGYVRYAVTGGYCGLAGKP